MLGALNDYMCDSYLSIFVKKHYPDLKTMSNIPSPIDDLVDSYWLLKVLMNDRLLKIKKIY